MDFAVLCLCICLFDNLSTLDCVKLHILHFTFCKRLEIDILICEKIAGY